MDRNKVFNAGETNIHICHEKSRSLAEKAIKDVYKIDHDKVDL